MTGKDKLNFCAVPSITGEKEMAKSRGKKILGMSMGMFVVVAGIAAYLFRGKLMGLIGSMKGGNANTPV